MMTIDDDKDICSISIYKKTPEESNIAPEIEKCKGREMTPKIDNEYSENPVYSKTHEIIKERRTK